MTLIVKKLGWLFSQKLFLITLLGLILRFAFLGRYPVSLNWDEVSHGYNAYSILKTGKDEWGASWPLIFRAFGDYKLPFFIYSAVLPVFLFGLNAFSVRFISALAGTLAIPGLYLLAKEIFPDRRRLHYLSSFILALLPWHFFISRPALEANLALTLIIFGFVFLLKYFRHLENKNLLFSVILLGLSLHTYNTARVFVPVLVVVSLLLFRPKIKIDFVSSFSFILASVFALLVVYQITTGEGTARYEKLKILSPSIVYQIGESRLNSTLPPLLAKLLHNRPVFFIKTVTQNYLAYFTPSFITQNRGAQFQFAIPGKNLLTWPIYLLFIIGLFVSLKNKDRGTKFIIYWLLASPLAASLTADPPQALRPNPLIVAMVILSVIGIESVVNKTHESIRRKVLTVLLSVYVLSSALYIYHYFTGYATQYSSSWQYGYTQIVEFIKENQTKYQNIFITKRYGEPHIFYAFFNKVPPPVLQYGSNSVRFEKSDWFWTDKIDNVFFLNDWQIPSTSVSRLTTEFGLNPSTVRSLLITSPEHVPLNAQTLQTVNFLDGKPAFIITYIP